ncbi:hypothetical protein KBB12_03785 [Candidatus Woesebacteria bacterium]|nr:hypothetical protein [Candidatus Woesebacteria bacterium]
MHHVAIMNKSWGLIQKILSGEKTIESRWYKTKRAPWDNVKPGDMVYFKNSGELVTLQAVVQRVLQFADLTPNKVKDILDKYSARIGVSNDDIPNYFEMFKEKRYCILIFLKQPKRVRPFQINKNGFGAMAAWIAVEQIDRIKKLL